MQRREFLRLAGAGAAAFVAGTAPPVGAADGPSGRGLRVEYRPRWSAGGIDARWLDGDDPHGLREGVRLTVFGFAPSERDGRGAAALDVHFDASTPAAVFHAWSARDGAAAGSAAANSFRVPLVLDRLRLDVVWDETVSPVELATESAPDLPGLRRGIYLLSRGDSPTLVIGVDEIDAAPYPIAPWRMNHV